MKKYIAVLFALTIICLNCDLLVAQSRRVPPAPANGGKMNKREPQTETTPAPAASPVPEISAEKENANDSAVETDGEIVKVDTNLVSIPVKVSDRKNRFIAGLTKENFQIFEENVPQEIAYFSNEEQPFTVALVLDMSYSTTFKISEIQSAAISFIAQLRPKDKVTVISFDGEVHMLAEPTGDRQILQRAVRSARISRTGTSLYDAVDLVVNNRLKRINGRKAIVLFTDGVDTTSRRSNDLRNLSDALESDALVYPIRYDTFNDVQAMKNKPVIVPPTKPPGSLPPQNPFPFPFPVPTTSGGGTATPGTAGTTGAEYKRAEEYLNEMANRTGGRIYQAENTGNLALAFSKIASELREYYSLGYYPKDDAKTGKIRRLKVRVDRVGAVARARASYIRK